MAQTPSSLNLMPMPTRVQIGTGQLVVDQSFTAVSTGQKDARLDSGIPRFLDQISRQTGMQLNGQCLQRDIHHPRRERRPQGSGA